MGVSQSGMGGGTPGTVLTLIGLAVLAIIIAVAANSGKVLPVDGIPSPAPSVTAVK